jgi:hypothetical protein
MKNRRIIYIIKQLKEQMERNRVKIIYYILILYMALKTAKKRHKWSLKYKKSINCKRPKGFSQKQYCKYGRKSMKSRKR